jgi:predicted RNase H-like nuclease
MDVYIGFDSAWTDNPKAPGAICAIAIKDRQPLRFYAPQFMSFNQALTFIKSVSADDGITLIALDQPTVVPNSTGMRPVDRVAASLAGWLGGGVQPANRGRLGMFSSSSPIWCFLNALGATFKDPEQARLATKGLYLMEVFPALALPSLDSGFFGRLAGPKYNPDRRKTFRKDDWARVAEAAAQGFHALGCEEMAAWCRDAGRIDQPQKADQDKIDSVLCVLIALRWRLSPRDESLLIGDPDTGYMVTPASPAVRDCLTREARKRSVLIDGASVA